MLVLNAVWDHDGVLIRQLTQNLPIGSPLMRLEELFVKLKDNPSVMPQIEQEVQTYIESTDIAPTRDLLASAVPEMKLYAVKIIEHRVRNKKMAGSSLDDEIVFMIDAIHATDSDRAAQVFALLGVYEWPGTFPHFFSIIVDLLSHKKAVGYKILEKFLYLCNYSQEINEARKSELKKGCAMMSSAYMPLFDDSMAEHIIPILTESLKIIPRDFDCSIVFRRGAEFPSKTIEFLSDAMDLMSVESVVDLASQMEISYGMIMCFNSLKNKSPKVRNVTKMYEYVFKGLRKDLMTFSASVEFWTKLFGQRDSADLCGEILTEVVSIYLSVDEEQRVEIEGEVFGLFNVICRNYPETVTTFLRLNGDHVGRKLVLHLLRKLFGMGAVDLQLVFKDPVLNCALALHRNNLSAANYIQCLDLADRESCKLVVRILDAFTLSEAQITQILQQCNVPDKTYANEIIVECLSRLGREEQFSGTWTHDEIIRLFFYLKKSPAKFLHLAPLYFKVFVEKAPFDRCFAILKMLGSPPDEILQRIYADMDSYSFVDLGCFNRDLLGHLKIQTPFIQKEVVRLVNEWCVSEDPEDLIACVKSLLQMMSYGINNGDRAEPYPHINEMVEMLQIDDPSVVKKIAETFNAYSGPFDLRRVVYLLVVAYNSSVVESAHLSIASSLTICIRQADGPVAFHEVLGIDLETCLNLQADVLKSQTRKAQNLVRVFLQDYKGKPLNTLHASSFRVDGQNFLRKTPRPEADFEIGRSFFENK